MSSLDISTTEGKQATVIKLSGSADMQEAALLSRHLEKLFSQDIYHLVLDLSDLQFTSSMGLSSFIQAHTKCRANEGHLAMVNPQPAVMRIFRTTRLDQLFDIYASTEEAIQAIGGE